MTEKPGPDLGKEGFGVGGALIESGDLDGDIAELERFPRPFLTSRSQTASGHGADLARVSAWPVHWRATGVHLEGAHLYRHLHPASAACS